MALIYGVNYEWNKSKVSAMCSATGCTYNSAFVLLPHPDTTDLIPYNKRCYCLQHLLNSSRNIHSIAQVQEMWL